MLLKSSKKKLNDVNREEKTKYQKIQNPKHKTQNPKHETQNSKIKWQNSKYHKSIIEF